MRRVLPTVASLLALAPMCAAAPAYAQQQAEEAPTIRVQSRLVIEDVLVMDAKGNPVHGLPPSAFHITDNGAPQKVRDFEEGSPKPDPQTPAPPLPPGTFTNATSNGSAPTTEVLLIDTDDMELVDQMFLLVQLKKAIDAMPPDLPASLFSVRAGNAVPLLLNTTDRQAMERIAKDILPVQNHAIDSKFQSATNQLMSVAAYLQQIPGRKNLLWFAGQFPFVSAGESAGGLNYSVREHMMHQVQEALAEARISVYPVDVRGVLMHEMGVAQPDSSLNKAGMSFNPRAVSAGSQSKQVLPPQNATDFDRRSVMRQLAAATGGRAYFLNNLAEEIDQAFDLGKSAYTLSYMPSQYTTNESFHNVRIEVDGGYSVSYRKGYLATWTGVMDSEPRYKLVAGVRQMVDPNQRKPLLFQARLVPQADPQHILVQFSIPVDQLSMVPAKGGYSSALTVTSYAYDPSGRVKDGKMQELDTNLSSEQYAQARDGNKRVATTQMLTVAKNAKYLVLIVRDKKSQRTGSLLLQTRILESLPGETASKAAAVPSAPGLVSTAPAAN